jgi:CelD/BcsL family acetyltransferase involved in cellulose biosynthesis
MTATPLPHRTPDALQVQVSATLAPFAALWPRSDRTGAGCCTVFQCADILDVWCDTIGRARAIAPVFVAVFAGETPAMLLPLGIATRGSVRVLTFLDGTVSDYNMPVLFPAAAGWDAAAAARAWAAVAEALPPFDVALLEKMPAAFDGVPNPLVHLATGRYHESCHVMSLGGTAEEVARRFPNGADSRRVRRRLEALGPVTFTIAQDEAARQEILAAMMTMKRRRFIETKGYDVFAEPGYSAYYEAATRQLGTGPVHLSALRVGETIIAAHWGYVSNGRFYYLMPSHAGGEYGRYAPGRLLNEFLITWSAEQGLAAFDFCIGDEPYKMGYRDVEVPLYTAALPRNLKGRAFGAALQMSRAAKTALTQTRLGPVLKDLRQRARQALGGHNARRQTGENAGPSPK